jgi:hypothetical protein
MKNIILEYTNQNHKEFLESISFEREFDPFKLKTWHSEFNLLENNPSIPIFEILEKPNIKITTIQDFLADNDITNTLVKNALEKYQSEQTEKEVDLDNSDNYTTASNNSQAQLSKFISKGLLNKV